MEDLSNNCEYRPCDIVQLQTTEIITTMVKKMISLTTKTPLVFIIFLSPNHLHKVNKRTIFLYDILYLYLYEQMYKRIIF